MLTAGLLQCVSMTGPCYVSDSDFSTAYLTLLTHKSCGSSSAQSRKIGIGS